MIALFGPTGVGKTAVAIALAERCAPAARIRWRSRRTRSRCTGAGDPHRRRHAGRARAARAPAGLVRARSTRPSPPAPSPSSPTPRSTMRWRGATPDRGGGTGLYLQAALSDLELRPPPILPSALALEADVAALGSADLHAELAGHATWPRRSRPATQPGGTRARAAGDGRGPAPTGEASRLWTARLRHPTLLCGLVLDREALYRADRRARGREWWPPGRRRRFAGPTLPEPHARRARRSASRSSCAATSTP